MCVYNLDKKLKRVLKDFTELKTLVSGEARLKVGFSQRWKVYSDIDLLLGSDKGFFINLYYQGFCSFNFIFKKNL